MKQKIKSVKTISQPKRKSVGRPRKVKSDESEEALAIADLNHWGDAPAYAANIYGDVAFHTTRFDDIWD